MRRIGLVAVLGYVATIFVANWLIQHVGAALVLLALVVRPRIRAAT
jgi:hypothetical protein